MASGAPRQLTVRFQVKFLGPQIFRQDSIVLFHKIDAYGNAGIEVPELSSESAISNGYSGPK